MRKEDWGQPYHYQSKEELLVNLEKAVELLAVAVAGLPGAPFHIEMPKAVLDLQETPKGGLTLTYRPRSEQVLSPETPPALAPTRLTPETVAQNQAPEPANRRVHLTGRLGTDPKFSETKKGTLIARFPVAVAAQTQEGKPHWQTVVAFGERAQQLQNLGLVKGKPVEVVGYEHDKTLKTKGGKPKTVKEVYAVVVKPTG